jgi:hypothetical protein
MAMPEAISAARAVKRFVPVIAYLQWRDAVLRGNLVEGSSFLRFQSNDNE